MSMATDIFKMGTFIVFIFCALVMSGKMVIVECSVYSTPDTALKFSNCLIDKMKQSQSFTYDELNSTIEVQDVMLEGLYNTEHSSSFAKILAISFITSVADIIIIDNVQRNTYRKQIYASALEQCLIWATGGPDEEFINEALRILSVIENNKALKYKEMSEFGGARNPAAGTSDSISPAQISGVDRSFAVQPSPVQNQNPSVQQYSNDKTIFEHQDKPYFPSLTSAEGADAKSQYVIHPSSQIEFSSGFVTGTQTRSENFPPRIDFPNTSQAGGFPPGFVSNPKSEDFSIRSDESIMPQFSTSVFGPHPEMHPPQYDTDRISISNDKAVVSPYFESPKIGPINGNGDSQSSYKGLTIPQTKESSVIVIPPKVDEQFAHDEYLSQNPERGAEERMYKAMSNLNPPNVETSEFSKDINVTVPQVQEQYSNFTSYQELQRTFFEILTKSPKFTQTFNTEIPKDNAINLARSITEQTFVDYDLNILNDALTIVTAEVNKVNAPAPENFALALSNAFVSILKLHEKSFSFEKSQFATIFLYSLDNSAQFNPEPEAYEELPQDYNIEEEKEYSEFNERKTDFDFGSPPLSPEDRKDEIFSISLAQYLSNSEAIRNFFCGDSATEDKVQIFYTIIKASLIDYGFHAASLAASVATSALSELSDEGLCNNYAKTLSEIIAEILEENEIDNANAENIANKMELNLSQRQIVPTESQHPTTISGNFPPRIPKTETYETAPKLDSSFESVEEITPNNQGKTKHVNLAASYVTDGVSVPDYEFTHPLTIQSVSSRLPTVRPTVNSPEWVTNGAINEEALADYLSEHTDTFEDYIAKENQAKESNDEETSPELIEYDTDLPTQEFSDKSQTPTKQKNNFNTQSDIVTTSIDQSDEDEDISYPTMTENKNANFRQQDRIATLQEDSMQPNIKKNPVELQPSFQDPVPKPEDSSVRFQPNSDAVSYDYLNPTIDFSRKVAETAESSIAFIRSPNFDLGTMCTRINQFSPLVGLQALDYCEPVAAVDFMLNVLRATVRILEGV